MLLLSLTFVQHSCSPTNCGCVYLLVPANHSVGQPVPSQASTSHMSPHMKANHSVGQPVPSQASASHMSPHMKANPIVSQPVPSQASASHMSAHMKANPSVGQPVPSQASAHMKAELSVGFLVRSTLATVLTSPILPYNRFLCGQGAEPTVKTRLN